MCNAWLYTRSIALLHRTADIMDCVKQIFWRHDALNQCMNDACIAIQSCIKLLALQVESSSDCSRLFGHHKTLSMQRPQRLEQSELGSTCPICSVMQCKFLFKYRQEKSRLAVS